MSKQPPRQRQYECEGCSLDTPGLDSVMTRMQGVAVVLFRGTLIVCPEEDLPAQKAAVSLGRFVYNLAAGRVSAFDAMIAKETIRREREGDK